MKYMRRTAGYIWTDYKTNTQIAKELKIAPIFVQITGIQEKLDTACLNRIPRNRLPRVMKHYSPQLAKGIMADL